MEPTSRKQFDLESRCDDSNNPKHVTNVNELKLYHVLAKKSSIVNGDGYMCSKTKVTITTHTTFFGNQYDKRLIESVTVSPESCNEMVRTKLCEQQPMNCIAEDHCRYDGEPTVRYSWLASLTFEGFHCAIWKKSIISNSMERKLFASANSACLPADNYCQMGHNVIVWKQTIVHKCPYEYIQTAIFYNISKLFISKESSIVVQALAFKRECGLEITETAEGLYLTENNSSLLLKKYSGSIATEFNYFKLVIADTNYQLFQTKSHYYSELLKVLCVLYKTQLSLRRNMQQDFFPLFEYNNVLILNNENGLITVPDCFNVSLNT
jgi:hypothetical protein